MARIKKHIELGNGFFVELIIDDGKAIMTSNSGKEMLKIYYKTKENNPDKQLSYNYRANAMIELFDDTAEEYSKKIDKDTLTAHREQKKAVKEVKENIKKEQNQKKIKDIPVRIKKYKYGR